MPLTVPARLVEQCRSRPEWAAWLGQLPAMVEQLCDRWSLSLGPPFEDGSGSWVAPVGGTVGGSRAVLKLGIPHMEAKHEIAGLRYWAGDGAVRLLEADDALGALLLERCDPGASLSLQAQTVQDSVIAGLLRRLWRQPLRPHPFRPLSDMTTYWASEARAKADRWPDRGLVEEGLRVFEALPQSATEPVLLATDLHAGNVLQARREPWLAIDPKPFVGDRAYDATQHLFNGRERLCADPLGTIVRFAELLGVDSERVRLWVFARAAIESCGWADPTQQVLARALAP